MQDRPTAAELVATVTEFLESEVLPNVDGTLRYHTLVAANLMKILRREVELQPAADVVERSALQELLGAPDEADLEQLNGRLHRLLLEVDDLQPGFEGRAWQVLMAATTAKLAVNKPGYDRYDMAIEVTP